MMKMIIVDDEPIIIQGLRYTIPWEEHGIEVVDVASDGEDALEKIKEHGALDIVLSDVKMPNMDGLQLAKRLREQSDSPKIIMISGYDEFEYAKQAIRIGVNDYLLKPVDIDELIRTVEKVKDSIIQEKTTQNHYDQLIIKDLLANQLLGEPLQYTTGSDVKENIIIFPFITSTKDYGTVIKNMNEEEIQKDKQVWQQQIDETLKDVGMKAVSISVEPNILISCIFKWNDDQEPTAEFIKNTFKGLKTENRDLYIITANSLSSINTIASFYTESKTRLKEAFIRGDNVPFTNEQKVDSDDKTIPVKIKDKFLEALNIKEISKLNEAYLQLFNYFKENYFLLDSVVKECKSLERQILQHYVSVKRVTANEGLELNLQKDISTTVYNSYTLIQNMFEEDMNAIYRLFHPEEKGNHHWLVDRALQYINEYYNQEIKASEVADYINISPNYFSAIFKQYTNMNFNEYLNELRVEKAKVLLEETSDKIVDISEQVGYQNYKYFVQIFKQLTKMTPTEYRKFIG